MPGGKLTILVCIYMYIHLDLNDLICKSLCMIYPSDTLNLNDPLFPLV